MNGLCPPRPHLEMVSFDTGASIPVEPARGHGRHPVCGHSFREGENDWEGGEREREAAIEGKEQDEREWERESGSVGERERTRDWEREEGKRGEAGDLGAMLFDERLIDFLVAFSYLDGTDYTAIKSTDFTVASTGATSSHQPGPRGASAVAVRSTPSQ